MASVLFGGGTPSLARPETIKAVIDVLFELGIARHGELEATVEINPTSVKTSGPILSEFCDAGVTRASIGVQALRDADLKVLTRRHTVAEALETLAAALTVFRGSTSLDLMFGRQGQGIADWESELHEAASLGVPHISLYELTLR